MLLLDNHVMLYLRFFIFALLMMIDVEFIIILNYVMLKPTHFLKLCYFDV